jgi:membrane protein involved in colicin uptake
VLFLVQGQAHRLTKAKRRILMKTRQLLITAALLAMTGGAMAQGAEMPPGGTVNGVAAPGPYVQKRQADADAKARYKAEKKAANEKAREEKKAAKKELRQQRRASTAERNAELAAPQAPTERTP